ncbi:hypothetical protein AAU61_02410 [Desulfocarbo indianensis]|nr:hypothetical protein AAU61_02410 [Desulfocarbo indianensis]
MEAITIKRDLEQNLTFFEVRGAVGRRELEEAIASFYEGGPTRCVLWDLRQADLQRLATQDVRGLIRFMEQNNFIRAEGRTALVAPRDADYGLARMGEVFAEGLPTQFGVFRSLEQALEWLAQGGPS